MTALDQNASDRPYADADRCTAETGADGRGEQRGRGGQGMEQSHPAARPADRGHDQGRGQGQVLGTGAPGVVEWSSGVWGAVVVPGQVRPQRRPAPSRRLSQVRALPPGPSASTPGRDDAAAERAGAVEVVEAGVGRGPIGPAGAPMGVLIGGSPGLAESTGQGGRGSDRRVSVRLLRFGSGTCQVVLPEWRPAIAVSVPTEQLQRSTGLSPEELRSAQLSVVINPEAVHDRELGLRDWRAEVPAARGRRRGRRQVR